MKKIYEVTVKELVDIDKNKYANKKYLCWAYSPTDAEATVIKEAFKGVDFEYSVIGAKETNYVTFVEITENSDED